MTGYVRFARLDGGASLFVLIDREGAQRHYDFLPKHIVSGNTDWTKLELLIPTIPDATRARVGLMVWGNGSAWFDDLHLEKIDTEAGLSDKAAKYLARALNIMESHSIVRDAVDWPDVRGTARLMASGAQETEDTYAALEYAINSMGDGHSQLLRPADVAILAGDDSAARRHPVMPHGERLDRRFGYVNVPGFHSTNDERMTRYADALQDLIARLDAPELCAWIVDLRGSLGGNER
jgi:hypothetical protein